MTEDSWFPCSRLPGQPPDESVIPVPGDWCLVEDESRGRGNFLIGRALGCSGGSSDWARRGEPSEFIPNIEIDTGEHRSLFVPSSQIRIVNDLSDGSVVLHALHLAIWGQTPTFGRSQLVETIVIRVAGKAIFAAELSLARIRSISVIHLDSVTYTFNGFPESSLLETDLCRNLQGCIWPDIKPFIMYASSQKFDSAFRPIVLF